MKRVFHLIFACLGLAVWTVSLNAQETKAAPGVIRSAQSGPWSSAATWEGGKVPSAQAKVQIRQGHTVLYDVHSEQAIRAIHIAGMLRFAHDKSTRLDVGLIRIQAGDSVDEEGFDCDHVPDAVPGQHRPALLVGTAEQPIQAKHTALIRLVYFDGMNKESCPAIVCCGGRMDFHGAPMNRTWLKLGAPAKAQSTTVTLAEPVTGWKVGDRVILTATTRQIKLKKTFTFPSLRGHGQTEERLITAISPLPAGDGPGVKANVSPRPLGEGSGVRAGTTITLDQPLQFDHICAGDYRGDVANLSRNVIVESANPEKARGHTMYHRGSAGSISYAEFRHLGMPGVLGRYSLHYHLAGDTMRGSSVIGASIWDSGNRWLTIHGTNYLVVRDCVGYQSMGHGFFLEDGTEVYNVLDRNLAVQGFNAKPLPNQIFHFDLNDGSGFWWANCLNTFTRNVACECDEYGFRFEVVKTKQFDPNLNVRQPDGSKKRVDIRTLPFVRFEDNEAHCQRRHAFNLGGFDRSLQDSVNGVGPDVRHPFVLKNIRSWNVHWPFHSMAPCVMLDGFDIWLSDYEIWRMNYDRFAYRGVSMRQISSQPGYLTAQKGTKPKEADFPGPLDPLDDLPPLTVITHFHKMDAGKLLVRGTSADNGTIKNVLVNDRAAHALRPNFSEWEVVLDRVSPGELKLRAHAEDAAGNVEKTPHFMVVPVAP